VVTKASGRHRIRDARAGMNGKTRSAVQCSGERKKKKEGKELDARTHAHARVGQIPREGRWHGNFGDLGLHKSPGALTLF
jgi:hypothetical protein